MASNIIDKVHNVTRQSHENRQFHKDFLSNFMQSYSINIGNSAVPDHSDAPKSPSILSRSPAPKTPVTKNPYANTISHTKDPSPVKAFYDLKQNYFSTQPLNIEKTAPRSGPIPEPQPNPVHEPLDTQEGASVVNNVDRLLNKWKRKHESWNLVEEKLVNDIKTIRNTAVAQVPNDDDVDALIMRVKKKINKADMDDEPPKDMVTSVISKYTTSPKSNTFQAKTETSPIVNKSQLSPQPVAQGAKYRNQFENALMEADQSPIRPVRDENSHVSFKASFDSKEGEDDDALLIYRSKGRPPQPQAPSAQTAQVQQQIGESKTTDKISGGSKVSLNQSSLPSDSISFNISESVIGPDQRKSRISEKDNASGESNIINTSQDRPSFGSTIPKDKKPEKIEKIEKTPSPAKKVVEEVKDNKIAEPKNERGIPKAPIMMQKTVKPVYKEVAQDNKGTRNEVVPGKRPQFKNAIKSKINMLKNIYAGRDPNAEVPERDTKPVRQSPKQEKRGIYDEESSEEKEVKVNERPEILVKDEEEEEYNLEKNIVPQAENYAPLSPQRESSSLDDLIYSKMTDEKMMASIDESAFRPRPDNLNNPHHFGEHALIDMSPMPKRQIDFEKASDISFTYSPEDSILHHDHGRGKENQPGKKVINPQQVVQKVGNVEWNEQMEREFEAYCDKDPEIIKLRSKINYLKGEIALASL